MIRQVCSQNSQQLTTDLSFKYYHGTYRYHDIFISIDHLVKILLSPTSNCMSSRELIVLLTKQLQQYWFKGCYAQPTSLIFV